MTLQTIQRVKHIDILKGISIILVVLVHSRLGVYIPEVMNALGPIRMPLFFFASGLFLNPSTDFTKFYSKKINGLLKPYFVVLFYLLFVHFFFPKQGVSLVGELIGIFYGVGDSIFNTSLWFLTHLFLLSIVGFWVAKYLLSLSFSRNVLYLVGGYGLCLVFYSQYDTFKLIIYGLPEPIKGLPFSLDLLPVSLPFFLTGYLFKERVVSLKQNFTLLSLTFFLYILFIVFTDVHLDLNRRITHELPVVMISALAGIYLFLQFSLFLSKSNAISYLFSKAGECSLFILIFHGPLLFYISYYFNRILVHLSIQKSSELSFIIAALTFVISIVVPIYLNQVKVLIKLISVERANRG